jgi:hypothetical protein
MSNLATKAEFTRDAPKQLVVEETSKLDERIICGLPRIKSMGNYITKLRNKRFESFKKYITDIPNFLKYNLREENFLISDSGCDNSERYIIFMRKFDRNWIKKSKNWIIDGTFYTAPKNFLQVLTIHGFLFGKSFPLVYILLTSKNKSLYELVFEK